MVVRAGKVVDVPLVVVELLNADVVLVVVVVDVRSGHLTDNPTGPRRPVTTSSML